MDTVGFLLIKHVTSDGRFIIGGTPTSELTSMWELHRSCRALSDNHGLSKFQFTEE